MAIWEAKRLCPDLIVLPPRYDLYLRFSRLLREIAGEYTDRIEPFGLDEFWAGVSDIAPTLRDGKELAELIQKRVWYELGITVSIGVSFNKIFAKLGSDLRKPHGLAVITPENYKRLVWPLPAGNLLGVGRATEKKLASYSVHTIGDLANTPPSVLHNWLHKWGVVLHMFANGQDNSPVAAIGEEAAIKSIGNSWTTPRDLLNEQDCQIVFYGLSESVAERLRDLGLCGRTVQIHLRDNQLYSFERQLTLPKATCLARELSSAAMQLLGDNYDWHKPLRSIGVRATQLVTANEQVQLSFFEDETRRLRWETLERTMDGIRRRFGHHAIDLAMMGLDKQLGKLDAKQDHVIHPVGYF
jgi:DNA polymerase-4